MFIPHFKPLETSDLFKLPIPINSWFFSLDVKFKMLTDVLFWKYTFSIWSGSTHQLILHSSPKCFKLFEPSIFQISDCFFTEKKIPFTENNFFSSLCTSCFPGIRGISSVAVLHNSSFGFLWEGKIDSWRCYRETNSAIQGLLIDSKYSHEERRKSITKESKIYSMPSKFSENCIGSDVCILI